MELLVSAGTSWGLWFSGNGFQNCTITWEHFNLNTRGWLRCFDLWGVEASWHQTHAISEEKHCSKVLKFESWLDFHGNTWSCSYKLAIKGIHPQAKHPIQYLYAITMIFRQLLKLPDLPLPSEKERKIILWCLLLTVEPLSHSTGMLQMAPLSVLSFSLSLSTSRSTLTSQPSLKRSGW